MTRTTATADLKQRREPVQQRAIEARNHILTVARSLLDEVGLDSFKHQPPRRTRRRAGSDRLSVLSQQAGRDRGHWRGNDQRMGELECRAFRGTCPTRQRLARGHLATGFGVVCRDLGRNGRLGGNAGHERGARTAGTRPCRVSPHGGELGRHHPQPRARFQGRSDVTVVCHRQYDIRLHRQLPAVARRGPAANCRRTRENDHRPGYRRCSQTIRLRRQLKRASPAPIAFGPADGSIVRCGAQRYLNSPGRPARVLRIAPSVTTHEQVLLGCDGPRSRRTERHDQGKMERRN